MVSHLGEGIPLRPHGGMGTLTPFVPLSLRAFKGEGEIRIEAHVRAEHAHGPLIQYWGEGRDGFRLGVGMRGGGGDHPAGCGGIPNRCPGC